MAVPRSHAHFFYRPRGRSREIDNSKLAEFVSIPSIVMLHNYRNEVKISVLSGCIELRDFRAGGNYRIRKPLI